MDLSALIFVALAVAWAVYLVPKALKAHEVDAETRSVDKFSDRMRVLAHREPVSATRAEFQVKGRPAAQVADAAAAEPAAAAETAAPAKAAAPAAPAALTPAQRRARRTAAARRRRRVLGAILLVNVAVVGVAVAGLVAMPWVAAPATLLVAWLVACRLMVKSERRSRVAAAPSLAVKKRRRTLADDAIADENAAPAALESGDHTEEIPSVAGEAGPEGPTTRDPRGWDPVPVTLPTYVAKAAAGRTVRTIDLDSTGVWSSGRNAADSELARAAEQSAKSAEGADEKPRRRVSGA